MAVLLPLWWGTPHYGRVCEPGLPLPLDHLGWYHLVGWRLEIGRRGLQDRPRLSPTRCGGKGHQPSSLRPKMLLQLRQMHWAGWCGALGNPGWVGGMGLHRCRCHWCTGRVPSMPQRPRAVPIWRFLHWSSRYWSWRESCCQERRYGLLRHPSLPLRFFPEPFSPFSPLVCGRPPGLVGLGGGFWLRSLDMNSVNLSTRKRCPASGSCKAAKWWRWSTGWSAPSCWGGYGPSGPTKWRTSRWMPRSPTGRRSWHTWSPEGRQWRRASFLQSRWLPHPGSSVNVLEDFAFEESGFDITACGEGSPLDYIPQQHWGIHSAGLVLVPHAS